MDEITGAVQSDSGAGSSQQVTLGSLRVQQPTLLLFEVLNMADSMFCSRGKYSVPVEANTHAHSIPHRGQYVTDRTPET